jgi:hypothetical protein
MKTEGDTGRIPSEGNFAGGVVGFGGMLGLDAI